MNNKIKKLVCSLFMISMICLVCGCGKNSNDVTNESSILFKQIASNDIVVCSDDFDLVFPSEGGLVERRLRFPIIAGKNISKEDIEVLVEGADYEVNIDKEEPDKLEDFTYLAYAGIDWQKYTKLYNTDTEKFNEYEKKYLKGYDNFNQKTLPKYNYYIVSIAFDSDMEDMELSKVKIKCKDKEYTVEGKISFSNEKMPNTNIDVFNDYGMAYDDMTIYPLANNTYNLNAIVLKPNKDIELESVSLWNNTQLKILKTSVDISGETSLDQILDKSPIKISKGDEASLTVQITNSEKKDIFTYTTNPILLIKYRMDGKEYLANVNIMARTIYNSSELYAKYIDELNIKEYYDSFYTSKIE